MNAQPKHRAITQHLLEAITSGKYRGGERLPSEAQLVQQFNVSRPTVGRALRDLLTDGFIERRAGSGTYVRTTPKAPVATRSIGLLVPGLANTEIFQIICGEIASLSRVHDYSLLWGGSTQPLEDMDASLAHAEELCRQFIQRKLSGVFFAPVELQP
jgi:LacI family transcriptional regulator